MAEKSFNAFKSFKMVDRPNMFTTPSDEDYVKIKSYLNGDIPKSEIFVYPILLCDNDEDRDNEQFSHDALLEIAQKYKGVTGIYDHVHKSDNQHSITFDTELITEKNKKNSIGEDYEYVIGYQYMLNTEKNKGLIDDIKAGIKKGASIGFEYKACKCSICGANWRLGEKCQHIKGKSYDGKRCVGILSDIEDAYEWSFVAVPAQRNAGVIKEYNNKREATNMDIKQVIVKACSGLSADESSVIMKAFEDADVDKKNKEIESLKAKVKAYEEENGDLKKKMADSALEDAKAKVYEGLKPKSDVAKQIADEKIGDVLKVNDDGTVDGIDEAKGLMNGDYAFLFDPDEEEDEEDPEGEAEEDPNEEEETEHGEKSKKTNKIATKSFTTPFSMGVKSNIKTNGIKRYVPGIREVK